MRISLFILLLSSCDPYRQTVATERYKYHDTRSHHISISSLSQECLCKFPNTTRLCPQCTALSFPSTDTNPPFNLFSTPLQGQRSIDPSSFGVHWSFSLSLFLCLFSLLWTARAGCGRQSSFFSISLWTCSHCE